MTDLQYEILSTIKNYNDRNKTILYGDVLNILRPIEPSIMKMAEVMDNLLKSGYILCGNNSDLDLNNPLTLTTKGKKVHKKDYRRRNPRLIDKLLKVLAKYIKEIIVAVIIAVISALIIRVI